MDTAVTHIFRRILYVIHRAAEPRDRTCCLSLSVFEVDVSDLSEPMSPAWMVEAMQGSDLQMRWAATEKELRPGQGAAQLSRRKR